jgi:hypothetical protein
VSLRRKKLRVVALNSDLGLVFFEELHVTKFVHAGVALINSFNDIRG